MSKVKRPPVNITPNTIMVSYDNIVICAGADTYLIDAKAFYATVPWAVLQTVYELYNYDKWKPTLDRIEESRKNG